MRLVRLRIAIALTLSASVGALIAAAPARNGIGEAIATTFLRLPNVRVGQIESQSSAGPLIVRDLTVGSAGTMLRIGRAALPFPVSAWQIIAPANALDNTITFDDVAVDFGLYQIVIPKVVVTGASVSKEDIAAIFDPKSPGSAAERVEKFSAATVTIPEIRLNQTVIAGASSTNTLKNVVAKGIAGGKITTLTVASVDFASKVLMSGPDSAAANAPPQVEATGNYGTATIANLNLSAILRILTEVASTNEPLVSLYDNYSLNGFHLSVLTPPVRLEVASGVATGSAKARPLHHPFTDLFKVSQKKRTGAQPSTQEIADAFAALSDVITAFQISAEIKDVSLRVTGGPAGMDGKMSRLSMSLTDNGSLSEALEGVSFDGAGAHVKIDQLGFNGLMLGPAARAFAAAAAQGDNGIKNANPRDYIPTLSQFIIAGVDVNAPAPRKDGDSEAPNRISVGLGKFELNNANFLQSIPTALSANLDHLSAELPKSEPKFKDLIALGYSRLDFSSRIDLAWREATQQIDLNNLSASGADMGTLSFKSTIGNAPKKLFAGSMAEVQAAADAMIVKVLEIKFENAGLIDKVIAKQARDQNKTAAEVKAGFAQAAAAAVPAMLGDAPGSRDVANAVATFITTPRNLHVIVRAPNGVPITDFTSATNQAALLSRIQLSATANE
jgi:hypothetical protein